MAVGESRQPDASDGTGMRTKAYQKTTMSRTLSASVNNAMTNLHTAASTQITADVLRPVSARARSNEQGLRDVSYSEALLH